MLSMTSHPSKLRFFFAVNLLTSSLVTAASLQPRSVVPLCTILRVRRTLLRWMTQTQLSKHTAGYCSARDVEVAQTVTERPVPSDGVKQDADRGI